MLARGDKKFWWQPFPGLVVQVLADGTPKATWTPAELTAAEPFAKDASLLHLLGADTEGRLWFDLAVPAQTSAVAAPTAPGPPAETPWKPETPAAGETTIQPAVVLEDWPTYLGQGLDRLYCWDSQKKVLQRFKWAALTVPKDFQKPVNGVRIAPDSGALLLENGQSGWLLPLPALVLGEPSNTGQPNQAR